MGFRRVLCVLSVIAFAAPAFAEWAEVSSSQLVQAANQSVIRHEWSTVSDSTPYDISACSGRIEARFDPSVSDASTDASVELRLCRTSSDTWQRCRPVRFEGADETSWTPINAITSAETYILAHPIAATSGGDTARVEVRCTESTALQTATSGGNRADVDNDGLYEVAYLWDADGDGSTTVTCTGNATPDIACKAEGEKVYRDTIDDVNCAIHDCGYGQMEYDGTLILGEGVFVGFPCWNASNEGNHTAANAEISDQYHDADDSTANCPVDSDGYVLTVISFQDWGGTFLGSGTDARELHRGLMNATLKRDKGTYLVNDMGPWHSTAADSVWFGGGADFYRMVSAGYSTNATTTAHHTGATAADGDSKGWWKVFADADFDLWGNDNSLCIQDNNGTPGVNYKTASTVANLERGDTILVPVKVNSSAANYSFFEVRVRDTPTVACSDGVNSYGLRVPLGGAVNATALTSKTYPAFASLITASDGQIVIHANSDYHDTNVTIANMSIEPQDYWNEVGGRCTNSGTPFRADRDASGTIFNVTNDNNNTDFSCDTGALVGFWGGGRIRLDNVNIKNYHFYPLDGGSSGGTHIASNVRWLYGQGGPAWDSGNGWQVRDSSIEMSSFDTTAFSTLGAGFQLQNLLVKNSRFNALSSVQPVSEGSRYENIRIESSQFDHAFLINCGVRRSTFRDIYITGRGWANPGGVPAGIYISCSTTSTPVTENVFDGFVEDPPGLASNDKSAPALLLDASSGNSAAILGNVFTHFRAPVYSTGTAGLQGCLFSAYDFAPGGAPDDAGESILFTNNYFSESSIPAGGRVFCVSNAGGVSAVIDSDAGTPAWGDPVGCGNMDGGVVYPDENCI